VKGAFQGIMIKYKDANGYISADQQAIEILEEANKLMENGAVGVAITYSANYGQTVDINQTYKNGGWQVNISGANQADVMAKMESLLVTSYSNLQGKMRIAPITTMSYSIPPYGSSTHEEVVKNDLKNIKDLLDKGWTVLGWQNQDSGSNSFAVGGGVAKRRGDFPQNLSDMVQTTLKQFEVDYPKS